MKIAPAFKGTIIYDKKEVKQKNADFNYVPPGNSKSSIKSNAKEGIIAIHFDWNDPEYGAKNRSSEIRIANHLFNKKLLNMMWLPNMSKENFNSIGKEDLKEKIFWNA